MLQRRRLSQISGTSFFLTKSTRLFSSEPQQQSQLCSKLCILGGGQMAEAILNALSSKKNQAMNSVHVFDISKERQKYLSDKYGVTTCDSPSAGMANADVTIIAVKPQNVQSLAQSIIDESSSSTSATLTPPSSKGLILSIVAGLTLAEIKRQFHTDHIVRSMPNTPAMVLEGITVWTATSHTPPPQLQMARELLASLGEQIEVADEGYLDMATAISGSGPAYVFLTMESMIDAAVHMGFPRDTAKKLVLSTIRGSASYAQLSTEAIPTLKNNVTSPGGTTASALYELEKGGFRTVVADAIWAAYRKALELGGKNSNVGPGRSKFKGQS